MHDSLVESMRWYVETLPRGGSAPIDTSRVEHGVAAVEMTGVTAEEIAATPQRAADLQRKLFGPPYGEED